jgi:hypothetical protein
MKRVIWIGGALAFVVLLISVVVTRQHEQDASNSNHKCAPPDNWVFLPCDAVHANGNSQQSNGDSPSRKLAYDIFGWPNGVGAWALFFTLAVVGWQAWETRNAVKAARDAIILQHRPRIKISSVRMDAPDDPNGFEIRMLIRNSGETAAFIQEGDIYIEWMTLRGRKTESRPFGIGPLRLESGEGSKYLITVSDFNARFILSRVIYENNPKQEQTESLSVSGSFIYMDEIGTRRETAILRLYDFRENRFFIQNAEDEYSD